MPVVQIIILVSALILLIAAFIVTGIVLRDKKIFSNGFIAKTALFSAISIILYCVPFLKFSLPIFPSFLEIHLDEIPAFIAGFAYGPLSGCVVVLIKTIVKLPMTSTACVGELADLLYSLAFVLPATLVYKKMHSIKGAIVSILIGTVVQVITASLFTTFVMLDVYVWLMPFLTKDMILEMCSKINPWITDLQWKFLIAVAVPFNALKDAMVVVVTLLLYKRLHLLIDKIGVKKASA